MTLMRRQIFSFAALLAASVTAPLWFSLQTRRHIQASRIDSAREAVGRAYLASYPEEGDAQALQNALTEIAGFRDLGEASMADLSDRQSPEGRAIAADFKAGRTRLVKGWILSLTECRICVAAALIGNHK